MEPLRELGRFYEKTVDNGHRMSLYSVVVRDDYPGGEGYCSFNRLVCAGVAVGIVYSESAKKKATFEEKSRAGSLLFIDCFFRGADNLFRKRILSGIHSPYLSL